MRVSLIVSVEDVAGFQTGLPNILSLLDQYNIQATFLFSLGFDNTGIRIKNLYRPSILSRQLPVKQKLYGTLLPPAALGKKHVDLLRQCAARGHDVGIKSYDSVNWQLHASDAGADWTKRHLTWSIESFQDIFDKTPVIHAASGFVINKHLLELEQQLGFQIAMDSRGKTAFYPEYLGIKNNVLQLPITLPAIEELLETPEITLDNVHEYLFAESQQQLPQGQLYEVRAAYEGRAWLSILEKMIVMWRSSQWEFNRVTEVVKQLDKDTIATHQLGWAKYQPANHYMATQSLPVKEANEQ